MKRVVLNLIFVFLIFWNKLKNENAITSESITAVYNVSYSVKFYVKKTYLKKKQTENLFKTQKSCLKQFLIFKKILVFKQVLNVLNKSVLNIWPTPDYWNLLTSLFNTENIIFHACWICLWLKIHTNRREKLKRSSNPHYHFSFQFFPSS